MNLSYPKGLPQPYLLPRIPYLRLRARLVAEEPASLPPFTGSMLRGAFGHALRRAVCSQGPDQPCPSCRLRHSCPYPRLFEPRIEGEPPPFLKGLTTAPRPYVFEPHGAFGVHPRGRELRAGEELGFDLLLLGHGVELQGAAVLALEGLARGGLGKGRGRFRLERVQAETPEGAWREVAGPRAPASEALAAPRLPADSLPSTERLALVFETPVRLLRQGRPDHDLNFRRLVFPMLRRVLELAHFHVPEAEVDWHFRPLLLAAEEVEIPRRQLHWQDLARYSQRQGRKMTLGGFVGRLELAGELAPFARLLSTAEVVHVGKGATFGLGRVRLEAL